MLQQLWLKFYCIPWICSLPFSGVWVLYANLVPQVGKASCCCTALCWKNVLFLSSSVSDLCTELSVPVQFVWWIDFSASSCNGVPCRMKAILRIFKKQQKHSSSQCCLNPLILTENPVCKYSSRENSNAAAVTHLWQF